MTDIQNAREYALDQVQQGIITTSEANVLIVQMVGVMVVNGKMPSSVRKSLNGAVKNGEIGRLRKKGLSPEVYHHKNARARAITEQRRVLAEKTKSLKKIFS